MKSGSLTTNAFSLVAILLVVATNGEINTAIAQSEDAVVARVNGIRITQNEVDNSAISQILPLEQQTYAVRKVALENLVVRTILEQEAKRQGVSVEDLRRRLTAGKIEILPSQVEELYAENASVFASMSPDEARERLKLDLENQARMQNYRAAILRLKETSRIELLLEEPRLPSAVDIDRAPAIGSPNAVITITEFSDFQCTYCRESQTVIKQILNHFRNEVRLFFKHLPLDNHAEAFASAQAAFCAGEQGFFWPYHDALFAANDLSSEGLTSKASDLGLSVPKFKACSSSESSRIAVRKDMQEAKRIGLNSTPTFIVNGRLVRGAISFEEFKTIIDRELKAVHNTSRSTHP